MIKFVHKEHAHKYKGQKKIIITYSLLDIVLGIFLIVSNVAVMVLIYNYIIKPQTRPSAPINSNYYNQIETKK